MGGFAALHFACAHPDRIRSLTLAGCGYGAKPDETDSHRTAMWREADRLEAIGMPAYAAEAAAAASSRGLEAKDAAAWRAFRAELASHSLPGRRRPCAACWPSGPRSGAWRMRSRGSRGPSCS